MKVYKEQRVYVLCEEDTAEKVVAAVKKRRYFGIRDIRVEPCKNLDTGVVGGCGVNFVFHCENRGDVEKDARGIIWCLANLAAEDVCL